MSPEFNVVSLQEEKNFDEAKNMSKKSKKITFIFFTFNEEKRIKNVIKNVSNYGKVLIIDNFSTDETKKIASSNGAKIVLYKNVGYGGDLGSFNKLTEHVDTPYIFIGSASEYVPRQILEECKTIAAGSENSSYRALACARLEITGGKWIQRKKPTKHSLKKRPRFLLLKHLNLDNHRIHHEWTSNCPYKDIKVLDFGPQTCIHHLRNYDVATSEIKHSLYGTNEAEQKYNQGRRVNLFTILIRTFLEFYKSYISKKDFLSGRIGIINSLMRAQMQMNIGLKIWEKQHKITLEEIIERNNQYRNEHALKELNNE
jgi:glycosyltransferase involved in cell wall biosynthesis